MIPHPNIPLDTAVPWWFVVSLRNRFYLKNFVETGTGYGDTSLIATHMFRHVHTVELATDVFKQQRRELQSAKNATRYNESSPACLERIAKTLDATGPNLFYLDGHWPGLGPKHGPECPLLDELRIICSRPKVVADVIMIDNAGLFIDPPPPPHDPAQWPSVQTVKELVFALWPSATFTTFLDVFMISEEPLILSDTND